MISTHVEIMDSDFHETHLDPQRRRGGVPKTGKVVIGENVLINPNVRILRGSRIGNNAVIGNSSLVIGNIPENVVAMGNPARVIFRLGTSVQRPSS
jgi:maltose O-acetyltransferase